MHRSLHTRLLLHIVAVSAEMGTDIEVCGVPTKFYHENHTMPRGLRWRLPLLDMVTVHILQPTSAE